MSAPFPDPHDGLLMGDIFAGVGGWELAAGADWSCVFSAEIDKHARKVWAANNGRDPDVADILAAPASAATFAHLYTISFPCQSSSRAGKRLGKDDPRGGQVLGKSLKMIESAKPVIVILENVRGFLSVQGGAYMLWLQKRLVESGYPVLRHAILGTHHFGLPQQRERLYMVAFRQDCANIAEAFRFPTGDETLTPSASKFLRKRLAKRYVNTIRCGGRGSKDRHAWDMIPRSGGGWYRLTIRDTKRLMGFPENYEMPVPVTQQFRLLGNAVPTQPSHQILRECKRVLCDAYSYESKRHKPHAGA